MTYSGCDFPRASRFKWICRLSSSALPPPIATTFATNTSLSLFVLQRLLLFPIFVSPFLLFHLLFSFFLCFPLFPNSLPSLSRPFLRFSICLLSLPLRCYCLIFLLMSFSSFLSFPLLSFLSSLPQPYFDFHYHSPLLFPPSPSHG